MIKVYGIPNCNTVKKALDWLTANGQEFTFHNFKKDGIEDALLLKWFQVFGWEQVINKRGLTFKKLTPPAQATINTAATALAYLLENTSAIKRPILEVNGAPLLLGFDETAYQEKLS